MSTHIENTYEVPDSIPRGLDVPDQTQALLDWVATVPDGSGPVYGADGAVLMEPNGDVIRSKNRLLIRDTFRVDMMFRVTGRTDLVFEWLDGKFVRVAQPTAPTYKGVPQTVWDHSNFCDLIRPWVVGPKPSGMTYQAQRETEHAFWFQGSVGCTVRGARTEKIWGDHLSFGKTNRSAKKTTNLVVEDCEFGESGRDPVAATACENVTVRRCSFGRGRTCVDMEPNGTAGGVFGLTVDGCKFNGPYTGNFFASLGNSDVGVVDGVTITNNVGTNVSLQALVGGGERRANFTVVNNSGDVSVGNGRACVMQFDGVEGDIVVTDNHNPVNPNRNMMVARFPNCTNATITYERNWQDDGV